MLERLGGLVVIPLISCNTHLCDFTPHTGVFPHDNDVKTPGIAHLLELFPSLDIEGKLESLHQR